MKRTFGNYLKILILVVATISIYVYLAYGINDNKTYGDINNKLDAKKLDNKYEYISLHGGGGRVGGAKIGGRTGGRIVGSKSSSTGSTEKSSSKSTSKISESNTKSSSKTIPMTLYSSKNH